MNVRCDIIRDLLPLYADDVCSAGSREMVETHLRSCTACGKELNLMKTFMPEPKVIGTEVDTARAAKKAWNKRKLKSVLIGILIMAVLGGVVYGLTVPNVVAVSEEHLEIGDVCRMESGAFYVELTVTDGFKHNYIRYKLVDGAFYITPMQPVITSREDPDFVDRKNSGWHVVGHDDCNALYVGWGDDAILVWEEGMDLPAASAELEEMYAEMHGDH